MSETTIDNPLRVKCARLGIEWYDEPLEQVDSAAAGVIPAEQAIDHRLVPVRFEGESVVVVMLDPFDLAAADEVAVLAQRPVVRCGMSPEPFKKLVEAQYGTTAARMAESLRGDAAGEDILDRNIEAIEAEDLHRMAEQPTLINLVNLIILEAIKGRASDVHIEPFETELKIKYRIDGVLNEQTPPPRHLQPAIISRIKIMAGMNIAERFVPQDGHITLRFEDRKSVV